MEDTAVRYVSEGASTQEAGIAPNGGGSMSLNLRKEFSSSQRRGSTLMIEDHAGNMAERTITAGHTRPDDWKDTEEGPEPLPEQQRT